MCRCLITAVAIDATIVALVIVIASALGALLRRWLGYMDAIRWSTADMPAATAAEGVGGTPWLLHVISRPRTRAATSFCGWKTRISVMVSRRYTRVRAECTARRAVHG
jgi:hypothetical protein